MNLESFLVGQNLSSPKTSLRAQRQIHKSVTRKPEIKRTVKVHSAGVKKPRANYCADFETTTDPNDCRVWAWGLADIEHSPETVEMGTDLDSFIERISQHNSNCYFHNLKFDGHFIMDWLLRHGYIHIISDRIKRAGRFKSLISDMGKVYSITVKWENGHVTEFRDSLKKFSANMSVERLAKTFQLGEVKGEIDYDAPRPIGHELTDEEKEYLRRDVTIVAQAMKLVLESGMKKLTIGSDSLHEYKHLTGMTKFESMFPVLSEDMDNEIRRAYRGGFTYSDPRFRGRIVGPGLVLDVNSLYPAMMKNNILPYGMPKFIEGYPKLTAERPLSIFAVTFTAKLKPNHIPCIQIKGHSIFQDTEYLTEINDPTTLMVTNVDWDLYNDHYDIDVLSYDGGWTFRASFGMFDEYIDKWSKVKSESKGGQREIAKLHLNSLYGKFASNPHISSKIPVLEDNKVKFKRGEDETRNPVYTAVGVFITSYGRDLTIRSAQANYDVFAYADTDSLHLLTTDVPESIEVHKSKLGAWKLEMMFDKAFYIRPKAYVEHPYPEYIEDEADSEYVVHIAGLPNKVTKGITFDDIVNDKVFNGKLVPKSVPGGVVLVDMPFQLKL